MGNSQKPHKSQAEAAAAHEAEPAEAAPERAEANDDEVGKLVVENADLRDRLLRAHAEMENVRRRTEREKSDTARYAISNFARDVLAVGDNIHRAIEHVPGDASAADPVLKSFLDGIQLTERELLNVLERHGVRKLEPQGERFDPNMHQAMFELERDDVPEGTVVQVMQAGYVIGDRCLRPALVGVSKGGAKDAKPSGDTPQAANDDKPGAPDPGEQVTPTPGQKPKVGGRVDTSA